MISYKPYSFLIKNETEPVSLISCFEVWIPAGKKLDIPRKTTDGNLTTYTYSVLNDVTQPVGRQEGYENEINWDGKQHFVKIIIGSGSGANGGTATVDSNNEFE